MSNSNDSKHSPPDKNASDETMMDAPDSPPEHSGASGQTRNSSFSLSSGQSASNNRANGDGQKSNFGSPGSSWNTKKFNEEYERAEHQLLDKDWKQQYGDPLMRQ